MNASKSIIALVACFAVAGSVLAAEGTEEAAASETAVETPLSRAEVLADLQIWRESGMAALQWRDEPAMFDAGYDAAAARYAALRAAPTFAALVERIAREHGDHLVMAGMK